VYLTFALREGKVDTAECLALLPLAGLLANVWCRLASGRGLVLFSHLPFPCLCISGLAVAWGFVPGFAALAVEWLRWAG
jgi:hypothetical protein